MRLVDHRADVLAFGQRIADRDAFDDRLHDLRRFGCLILVNEDARGGDAALPRIGEDALDRRRENRGEVGAGQHDVRRLAAQFGVDALDGVRRCLGDQNARTGRTGEADHVDVGVRADCLPCGRAVALNEVEHACGHARRVHHLRQDVRAAGAFLAGFQDHGVASGDSRSDLQRDLVERPVPRRDHADHADRFIHDVRIT